MCRLVPSARRFTLLAAVVAGAALIAVFGGASPSPAPAASPAAPSTGVIYHSPVDLKYSPDGSLLAVSDRTAGLLQIIDSASGKMARSVPLGGKTGAVAWSADGKKIYITQYNGAFVAEINAADGAICRKMATGAYPVGVAVVAKRNLLLVSNTGLHDLSVIDLASGKEKTRVKMVREPYSIAVAPDESVAVLSNLLPSGAASEPATTACLSILDLQTLAPLHIKLPPNSGTVRDVAVSADGRWAYAVHTVGRTTLPSTQLDRGWVNTNAFSIIELKTKKHVATILLDSLAEGAADPWGLALDRESKVMWISLSGTHQIARIDLAGVHARLDPPPAPAAAAQAQPKDPVRKYYGSGSIWDEIKADPAKKSELVNDLAALYVAQLIQRIATPAKGPRGIALSPDGKRLAVAQYFGGDVAVMDTASNKFPSCIALGNQPAPDPARRGEMVFHDANYTFQKWLTCATCHPNEGRVDGLNWDLTNDGIGNPKNNKSLLYAHLTPPSMWLSVREGMDEAVKAGFRFNSQVPPEEDAKAVEAYIASLKPDKSPYRLPDGKLTEKALRGKAIFEDEKVGCAHCHSGPYFTNQKRFNVGTHGPLDHPGEEAFDTPSLIEMWRTAPYLHDGRAATVQDLFTKLNPHEKHGKTAHLRPGQIDDLAEYLLSLD